MYISNYNANIVSEIAIKIILSVVFIVPSLITNHKLIEKTGSPKNKKPQLYKSYITTLRSYIK